MADAEWRLYCFLWKPSILDRSAPTCGPEAWAPLSGSLEAMDRAIRGLGRSVQDAGSVGTALNFLFIYNPCTVYFKETLLMEDNTSMAFSSTSNDDSTFQSRKTSFGKLPLAKRHVIQSTNLQESEARIQWWPLDLPPGIPLYNNGHCITWSRKLFYFHKTDESSIFPKPIVSRSVRKGENVRDCNLPPKRQSRQQTRRGWSHL